MESNDKKEEPKKEENQNQEKKEDQKEEKKEEKSKEEIEKARKEKKKEKKEKKKAKAEKPQPQQNPNKKEKDHHEKDVNYYTSSAKLLRPNKNQPVYPDPSKKNILITSALPYVNNVPHLGTLIGCVLSADVFARYCRLKGYNTLYICGTDEYGTATETKALEEGLTPQQVCDKYFKIHDEVYKWFDCDFDYFGRTSAPEHTPITQGLFLDLLKNGYCLKKQVEEFKCEKCDKVLSDRFIYGTCYHGDCKYEEARGDQCDKCGKLCNALELINPKCKICNNPPTKFNSFHYYINLPKIEEKVKEWINKTSEEGKWSSNAKSITQGFIKDGLIERCITRDLKWGIKLPSDDPDLQNKVFYVWFDACIGYISITAQFLGMDKYKLWWQDPDHVKLYQFMGKDNTTFHTVIFPATLIGSGENWVKLFHLSTTEYLNYEDTKFSKSKGTGVFGDMAESTGIASEVWRYYLISMRPEAADTLFKWDDFTAKNNNELLSNLGNLINRILVFTFKNFEGKIPNFNENKFHTDVDVTFLKNVTELYKKYNNLMEDTQLKDALKVFMEISSLGNQYFQVNEPWNLLKKNSENYDVEKAETVFYVLCSFVRFLGALAEPFMPSFSAKLYEILNIKYEGNETILLKVIDDFMEKNKEKEYEFLIKADLIKVGNSINKPLPLFKKISEKECEDFKKRFDGSQVKKEKEEKKEQKNEEEESQEENGAKATAKKEEESEEEKENDNNKKENEEELPENVYEELFVRNIGYNTTEEELADYFAKYGDVEVVKIVTDKNTGKSRGFGFLKFYEKKSAFEAMKDADNIIVGERNLQIRYSNDKGSQMKGGNGGNNSAKKGPSTEFGIFVGNISYKCTENDLKKFFKDCGKVVDVRIAKKPDGKLKGFAHVDFETKEGMEKAVEKNGKELQGRALKIDQSTSGGNKKGGNFGNKGQGRGNRRDNNSDPMAKAKKTGGIIAPTENKVTTYDDSDDE
jgi:methionyl-tRNA synthetase